MTKEEPLRKKWLYAALRTVINSDIIGKERKPLEYIIDFLLRAVRNTFGWKRNGTQIQMNTIHNIAEITSYIEDCRGIVFDLDDTLYSEKEYVRSGYRAIAKVIPQVPDAAQKLWDSFLRHENAIDVVLHEAGIASEEVKQKCLEAYRFQVPEIHLYEGVAEMLTALQKDGHVLGIITDGRPEGQHAKLKALHLEERIPHIIITDELGGAAYRKPNPSAFMKMQKEMQIPFSRMVYIGDNLTKDFIAPEALGMKTIHFANTDGLYYGQE